MRAEKSCRIVCKELEQDISRQTVCNILKDYVPNVMNFDFSVPLRDVDHIYIEADEDHIKLQNGKSKCVNLVYIHEGYKTDSNYRNYLVRPLYLPPMTCNTWGFVKKYVDNTYSKDTAITISADGANWIKSALNHFPDATFKLDKFHTYQAITRMAGTDKNIHFELTNALRNKDRIAFLKCYDAAVKNNNDYTKINAYHYLFNNFKYIDLSKENHCSAEAHISHVYAKILSSRPKGWSEQGAIKMAFLRCCLYSNIDFESILEPTLRFKNSA